MLNTQISLWVGRARPAKCLSIAIPACVAWRKRFLISQLFIYTNLLPRCCIVSQVLLSQSHQYLITHQRTSVMAHNSLVQLTFILLTQYLVIVLSSPVKFVFDVEPPSREEKSLLNTFPFNQQETDHTTTRTNKVQTHGRQEKNVPQPFRNLLTITISSQLQQLKRDCINSVHGSFILDF